jgi:hypothetical protein
MLNCPPDELNRTGNYLYPLFFFFVELRRPACNSSLSFRWSEKNPNGHRVYSKRKAWKSKPQTRLDHPQPSPPARLAIEEIS